MGPVAPQSVPETSAAEAPSSGDRIEISSQTREVGQLKKMADGIPEVRLEKIEDIRGQVEDGSYHVESEVLARRVVNEVLGDAVRRKKAEV